MDAADGVNIHFRQLLAGAPHEVAAQFGEALLAVDAQRCNMGADASALLRKAYLALAKHLVSALPNALTPEQLLFLLSGAIGDSVRVKNHAGERVQVQLLPPDTYESLLRTVGTVDESTPPACLVDPARRMDALAQHRLEPLDLNRPGRYRDPTAESKLGVDAAVIHRELDRARQALRQTQAELQAAIRRFTHSLRADQLGPALKELAELGQLASRVLESATDSTLLAQIAVPSDEPPHRAVQLMAGLQHDLDEVLGELVDLPRQLIYQIRQVKGCAGALTSAAGGAAVAPGESLGAISPEAVPRIARDMEATHSAIVQIMLNSPHRTPWSSSRVLLAEHTEKFADPLDTCYATPANLAASIRKIDALHPNCFPHDPPGSPLLPPVIIEPGVDIVRWLDDRFLVSFVCIEPARPGKELTLTPVDLAVMQIYGLFLARGDIFNYRGERIYTNFMGEYAGELESKAAVKFTGAEKKMTIVSSSAEKDASSREDAVHDYVDFFYCVFNNLPIPKRISPRKVCVLLKYCTIESVQRTATLVLRHVVPADFQLAREIMTRLADRNTARIVDLIDAALAEDQQLAARYRRDVRRALEEVMGRDFARDAAKSGALGPGQPATRDAGPVEPPTAAPEKHDYFDV